MTTTTMYGGADTSYADNLGQPLGTTTGNVYADLAKTTQLTSLTLADGTTAATNVTTDARGHYKFGVVGHSGVVYVDFGLGPHSVQPADAGDRLVATEAAIAALAGAGPSLILTDGGTWAATTAYAVGAIRTEPDGSRRIVTTAYTSGSTYGSTDTTNSVMSSPAPALTFNERSAWAATTAYAASDLYTAPDGSRWVVTTAYTSGSTYGSTDTTASKRLSQANSTFTQTVTDGLYAPLSGAYGQMIFWDGGVLTTGFDLDPSGVDMPAAGTAGQLVCELDLPPAGSTSTSADGDIVIDLYKLVPATNVEILVGTFAILNRQVSSITSLSRTHTVGTTSGSPVVTDTSVGIYDKGWPVTGAGIPANSYVGTVIAGTSFRLSSSPTSQVDVNATATASSVTATVGATLSYLKKDKIGIRLTQVGSAFPGSGLKVRLMLGSETAATVTAPTAATSLANPSSDASSTTITWANASNSTQAIIWRGNADGSNMVPYWNMGTLTSFTDRGPDGSGLPSGSLYAYAIQSRRYTAVTALTSTIVAGTSAPAFDWFPNATGAGAIDPAMATATVGSAVTGTPVNFGSGGAGPLVLTGGISSTNNNVNDRVSLLHIKDATLHTGWFVNALWHPLTAATVWALAFETNGVNLTTTGSKEWQLQFQQTACRLGGHMGTATPSGLTPAANGAAGSFQNFTDPAFPTNIISGATRTSTSGIALTTNFSTTVDQGFRLEALPPVSGSQVVNVKMGTAAQYGGSGPSTWGATAASMPTLFTATFPSTWLAAVGPGAVYLQLYGLLTTGVTPFQLSVSDFKVGALTAAGV